MRRPGMTVAAMAMLLPLGAGAAESAAAKPKPAAPSSKTAVAADFLEYLATLEGDDDNWTDFELATEAPTKNPKAAAPEAAKTEASR